ncbi:MAG: BMC domain-containing protein [Epulopiscium sp.]|nr:BMC domain-containing protein [Candidatus Epulonipiscium sp.]
MGKSVGLLEVYGLAAAFVAADAACKAANVVIEAFDRNKPFNADKLEVPLIIVVKLRGSLSDVREAVEAGKRAAEQVSGVVLTHIIPSPEEGTDEFLKINCLKNKTKQEE